MDGTAARKRSAPEQPSPGAGEALGDQRRARLLFIGLISVYAIAMAVLVALGLFGFLWKTVIIPSLFAVAYLAGRFRAFVRDWAVYIGAVALFDSCRGLVYGLTQHFELPVHMGYAIRAEELLFGTPLPTIALQARLLGGGVGAFEKTLVVVHASHFLVFLCFGLLLWLTRAGAFERYRVAMILTMGIGIFFYLLVPTVPPWMAANRFFVLPAITQVTKQVYNLSMPTIAASFDVNPIAAMPSLHTAFPTLLTLVCIREYGRWGFVMALYLVAAVFGIIYMGEHYIVDTMGGFALAVGTYLFVYRSGIAKRWFEGRAAARASGEDRLGRTLVLSAILLGLSQAAGLTAQALHGDELPTEAFIARELDGRSPSANYYRGLRAYRAGEFARAQPLLAKARYEVPTVAQQLQASLLLGESAYHNGDYPVVARTLGSLSELTPDQRAMLADTRFALGQREQALQLLDRLRADPPRDRLLRTRAAELLRNVR